MAPMVSSDRVLDCLVDDNECLYRIQRDVDQTTTRVVYVTVDDPTIIPEDDRTYGRDLVKHLQAYPEWNHDWTTMNICRNKDGQVQCIKDAEPPPELPRKDCPGDLPFIQVTQLHMLESFKYRVGKVQCGSDTLMLKCATFAHEIRYLRPEISVYHFLNTKGSTLVPKMVGYACEEDRVVGFLCEWIDGYVPSIDDLAACRSGLEKLHSEGVVHGDINKYNIIITTEGAKFIDLENAKVCDSGADNCDNGKDKDLEDLERMLVDESGWGRPWND